MNFDKQVCSLELAQKLKYLGVKQESLHCYYKSNYIGDVSNYEWVEGITLTYQTKPHGKSTPAWCAFTVQELGEMLPGSLTVTGIKDEAGNTMEDMAFRLRIEKHLIHVPNQVLDMHFEYAWSMNYVDEYGVGNDLIVNRLFPHNVHGFKEADVRAQFLIQLIEAGFVKIGV